jgi:hypothetical protein
MPHFPRRDVRNGKDGIGIVLCSLADVDHDHRHDEFVDPELVERATALGEMVRRIDLRAQMLVDFPAVGGDPVGLERPDRFQPEGESDAGNRSVGEGTIKPVGQVQNVLKAHPGRGCACFNLIAAGEA